MTLKEILAAMASSIKNNYVSKKELGDLAKHYSYIIDFSKSDPASMITYADDSDAAAMSTDWFDILGLKLCVLMPISLHSVMMSCLRYPVWAPTACGSTKINLK